MREHIKNKILLERRRLKIVMHTWENNIKKDLGQGSGLDVAL
jgi:hypothetical protein